MILPGQPFLHKYITIFQWNLPNFYFLFIQNHFSKFVQWSQFLCLNFSNISECFSFLYTRQSRESRVTYASVMGKFGKVKLGMLSVGPSLFLLEHVVTRKYIYFSLHHIPHIYVSYPVWGGLWLFDHACIDMSESAIWISISLWPHI